MNDEYTRFMTIYGMPCELPRMSTRGELFEDIMARAASNTRVTLDGHELDKVTKPVSPYYDPNSYFPNVYPSIADFPSVYWPNSGHEKVINANTSVTQELKSLTRPERRRAEKKWRKEYFK